MSQGHPRPQVFPMSRANARLNNPTSRSVRLVTPESSGGQDRLYAGAFWSEPGADAGWAFVAGDPDQNTMAGGIPHLGDHDEVYLCLAGRILADWEGDGETGCNQRRQKYVLFHQGVLLRKIDVALSR